MDENKLLRSNKLRQVQGDAWNVIPAYLFFLPRCDAFPDSRISYLGFRVIMVKTNGQK